MSNLNYFHWHRSVWENFNKSVETRPKKNRIPFKMSEYGANLQSNIMELVKYVENFKNQRQKLDESIRCGESEQAKMVEELDLLQERLNLKMEKLNAMKSRRDDLNRKLDETETHLKQLLDTSDVVLNYIKRETSSINKKIDLS
ncbi:uncharacterized protein LOC116345451 [Contarinia nasturtii]|uniref:uncharacterized protein LOC116345451 n=1 Tax=Contarinia nasturtii TaxID=265458 RepID=UPI0012D3F79C|nr:uncharacterized protein LOC116345451 [Contarinia nasturtii]